MQFRKVFIVFSFVLVVTAFRAGYPQGGVDSTGNGGMHTIQGRIYMPNGRTPDAGIPVKLESLNHRTASLQSDRNGGFAFKMLTPGNYTIVVDAGENYVIATEYFTIDAEIQGPTVRITPIPKVFNVPIYLQFKPNSPLKNEVVNAKFTHIPKQALEHCQKGLELNRAGKSEEAVKAFRLAIAAYSQFALPHTEIGKIYLKIGKFEDAFSILATAIAIDPKDFESKLNYGIALMYRKDVQDAEKELRAASDLDRTAVTPHYYLGLLFMQNRDLEGAQKELEAARSLKGDKDFPLVHKYLGGIYWAKKEYRMAAAELEKYVQLSPDAKDAEVTRKTISDLKNREN
jgi:Flp pilus assembly protein TadD